ncbi:MAG TPA: hypothetical protein VFN15_03795 [Solirubrobacterales bacterium]|nr:hypothetical protein [Solirubrobacterales bacterium]
MISAILAGALIAAASLLAGAALMVLAGRPRHSAAGPAAGISALLVICGIAVKLPGHGVSAAVASGVALVAAVVVLARSRAPMGPVRIGALVAVIAAALVVAIPFASSGRVGILGQGLINDDMASHLLFAEWVDAREGPTPDLIEEGYPLGPHAIVSATSKVTGADLVESFAGLTGAIAVLAALTAFGALRGVRGWLRAPAAALAALPYLGAAYLAQGAFKEPLLGLALVGFALSLPALARAWSGAGGVDRRAAWRAALVPGVVAAGTIYNYSFPGLAWLALAAVAWALIVAWSERGSREGLALGERWRSARGVIVAGVAIPLLLALPELVRIASFAGFEAFSPSGEGGNTGFGNLRQALNPLEALGVWPSSEFRIAPKNSSTPELAFYAAGLLGLVAFGWGLGRALARRERALPAALAAGAAGYLVALAVGTPYTSAKALAITAPVVMLVVLRGLLSADPVEGEEDAAEPEAAWWPPRAVRPLVRLGVPALTVVFAAAAAFSTLLPLRQSAVGPTANSEVLMDLRPYVRGEEVLFLGRDNFISWELLGAEDVHSPVVNHYDTEETSTLYRATPINAKFDWDNVPAERVTDDAGDRGLEDFDWVLTTSAEFNSVAPPGFTPKLETGDFILWERVSGQTPREGEPGFRRTLLEPIYPGATLDCTEESGRRLSRIEGGTAVVLPRAPAIGKAWEPGPDITDAAGAVEELSLTPGPWAISMQYASTQDLHVTAPGFGETLDANLLFRGPAPYYPVGTIQVGDAGGPTRFTVTVGRPPLAGRLLGTESRAYLGRIVATPLQPTGRGELVPFEEAGGDDLRERVPLSEACGRYIDWYEVPADTPASALAGVEAPTPRPPEGDE